MFSPQWPACKAGLSSTMSAINHLTDIHYVAETYPILSGPPINKKDIHKFSIVFQVPLLAYNSYNICHCNRTILPMSYDYGLEEGGGENLIKGQFKGFILSTRISISL